MDDAPEHELRAGALRCTVSPYGASLRRLWRETETGPSDLAWGYSGTANKKGGQGDVLMPWPGRIRDGTYTWDGAPLRLPCNDKDGPNAIHGFLRTRLWETGLVTATSAHFRARVAPTDHPGYPFALDIVLGYELLPSGLACAFVVRNTGAGAAPFGAGFHPYIAAPAQADGLLLESPASQVIEFDGLLPTGRVLPVPRELDFQEERTIGATRLNHCFTGLRRDEDGFARVIAGDVEVWMDRGFPYLVLYTGDALGPDARRALAVEPMTCGTDAFNHPQWGLRVLAPGEAFSATWGIAPLS